ncbi:hypothetical protein Anas_02812 [Armadillidium nasatum]|uniref:Uncharacterized protein n=1 Tax=Armadillidium nasatum TaxID=96803 RepID=A0A5N5SU03_9CRUS|nr:hypothetical protein Anas_02812 [Armadillidium nasatum]
MASNKFTRYSSLNKYVLNYCVSFRHMCVAKFLPLNLNVQSSQKEKEVRDLLALFRPDCTSMKKNIYMEYLNFSEKDAMKLLKKTHKSLSHIELINRISICEGCFATSKIGFEYMFARFTKRKIYNLQASGLIDNCTDLPGKLFHSLHVPQNAKLKLPPEKVYKDRILRDFWTDMNVIFLKWQLELSEEISQKIMLHCQKNVSLTYQHEIIQLLRKYLNFNNSKGFIFQIVDHLNLLTGIPKQYTKYLEGEKKLFGVSLIDVVKSHPSILKKPIQEEVILREQIFNYINRLTLKLTLGTTLSRISYFIRKTSLSDFRLTPNNEIYITHFGYCKKIIKEYEAENGPIKYLPVITGIKSAENKLSGESPKIMYQTLHFYFGLSYSDCLPVMKQIGLVNFPQIHVYKSNFAFLLNNGFSVDVLRKAFQILLFPHDLVAKTYYELPDTTKYMKLYQQNNDMDKIIQLLLYKVYKNYQSLSASLLIT